MCRLKDKWNQPFDYEGHRHLVDVTKVSMTNGVMFGQLKAPKLKFPAIDVVKYPDAGAWEPIFPHEGAPTK